MAAEALLAQWQGGVNDGVKEASASEIVALLALDAAHAHLPVLLPAAFDESAPSLYAERLNSAARKLLTQLEGGTFAEPIAKKVVEWLNAQLDHLSDAQLVQIIELILSGLPRTVGSRSHHPTNRALAELYQSGEGDGEVQHLYGRWPHPRVGWSRPRVRRPTHPTRELVGEWYAWARDRAARDAHPAGSNQLESAHTCSNLLEPALLCSNVL